MQVQQGKNKVEQTIKKVYEQLSSKLNNDLIPAYDDYQKAIDEQNKLLEKVQILKERNALLEKQILFLRMQDKEIVGLSIDSTSIKQEVK
ncbi:MAG: hypothetical protein LBJ88_04155 [Campylobacteraceae bacterium]|nr:hypothetical protein [Campylobacteraceae bacterium]